MVDSKTIVLAGAALAVVAGVAYYASSGSNQKMITAKGEGEKRRRHQRKRKGQSNTNAAKKPKGAEPTTTPKTSEVTMKEWTFEPLGITIQIPQDWTAEEATEAATFITKFGGLTHEKSQALIVVESHQESISPEKFLEKFKEVAQGMLPVDFEMEKEVEFAGRKGFETIYTQDLSRFGQPGVIKNYVCLTTIRNLGLCFQFTASSTDFDDDLDVVKKAANSLQMELPPSTSTVSFVSEDGFGFNVPSIQYDANVSSLPVSENYEIVLHLTNTGEGSDKKAITVVKLLEESSSLEGVISSFHNIFKPESAEKKERSVLGSEAATFSHGDAQALCLFYNNKGYIIEVKGADADAVFESLQTKDTTNTTMHFCNHNLAMEFDYPPTMNVSEGVSQVTVTSAEGHPFSGVTRTSFDSMGQEVTLDMLSQLIDREAAEMSQQGMSISINSKDSTTVNGLPALRVDMDQTNPYVGIGVKEVKTFVSTPAGVVSISSSTTAETFDSTDKVRETFLGIADSFRVVES